MTFLDLAASRCAMQRLPTNILMDVPPAACRASASRGPTMDECFGMSRVKKQKRQGDLFRRSLTECR